LTIFPVIRTPNIESLDEVGRSSETEVHPEWKGTCRVGLVPYTDILLVVSSQRW